MTREGQDWQRDLEVRMKQCTKKRVKGWGEPSLVLLSISKLQAAGKEPRKHTTVVFICRAEQREGHEIDVKAKGHD